MTFCPNIHGAQMTKPTYIDFSCSATNKWIKFVSEIHVPLRTNHNNAGDPLTFHGASSLHQIYFCLDQIYCMRN